MTKMKRINEDQISDFRPVLFKKLFIFDQWKKNKNWGKMKISLKFRPFR
jgi:hypothetical protein